MTAIDEEVSGSTRRLGGALMVVLALLVAGTVSAQAGSDDDRKEAVYGIWASGGTLIEVGPTADGTLSARIIALKNPRWREKDGVGLLVGEPKTDLRNPVRSLRDRPLLGLEILEGYRYEGGRWQGRLYLPSSGSTWTSRAQVRDGRLQIRGFLGVPLLGRTQTFVPLAHCNEDIRRMIEDAGMRDTPCHDKQENAMWAEP